MQQRNNERGLKRRRSAGGRIGGKRVPGAAVLAAAATLAAYPAAAHDFWLQMKTYHPALGQSDIMTILVGHGPAMTRWSGKTDRVVMMKSVGRGGATDLRAALKPTEDSDAVIRFTRPGTEVLAFQSNSAESELPGIRFTDYAKLEGLTPALEARAHAGKVDAPGREIYSRRAKALVQVGPSDAGAERQVTTPLGMTLEIVPEKSPYALAPSEPLPVRILYEGRPLAGALVKLTNLEFDIRPVETHLSDASGRAAFHPPRTGTWLLNVIWTKPISGNPKGDFDTTFSSLTFGFNQPVTR